MTKRDPVAGGLQLFKQIQWPPGEIGLPHSHADSRASSTYLFSF
jgi:hypothetical protein